MSEHTEGPDITGTQVNLFCHDPERCLAFYTRLGLAERFRAPTDGALEHVEVEAAGARIGLTSAAAANRLAGLGVVPGAGASTELVLWCTDVDTLHTQALAAGATEVTAPTDSPDGRLRYGWVRDPEGHQVKFVQPR